MFCLSQGTLQLCTCHQNPQANQRSRDFSNRVTLWLILITDILDIGTGYTFKYYIK